MVKLSVIVVGIVLAFQAAPAFAAGDDPTQTRPVPEMLERLFECRKNEDPMVRLACLERQTAEIEAATNSRELVVADRAQIREAKRGLFGLSLPKLGIFGGGGAGDEERIDKIETSLQAASQAAGGKWLLVLEDGAKWLQSDSTPVLGSPRAGDALTIERGAMGSYMAKIGKKRAFRVQRIN